MLIVDTEFKELIPPLSDDEKNQLEENILREGVRDPIVVWNGIIIDGHNRYEIAQKHGLPFETVELELESREAVRQWMIMNQIGRRNLSMYERSLLALKLKDQIRHSENNTNTRAKLAEIADVSENTINRVEYIEEKASEETKEKLRNREMSLNKAFEQTRQEDEEKTHKPHITFNSGNNEWYTPENIIEAARNVMGSIDVDPASNDIAQEYIKAEKYFTIETNGLIQEWHGNVWMNPPYAADMIGKFINKLNEEVEAEHIDSAIVLVNNATETTWFRNLLTYAKCVCFPYGRVKFITPGGESGSPLQGQAIIYIGDDKSAFVREFEKIGWVCNGIYK